MFRFIIVFSYPRRRCVIFYCEVKAELKIKNKLLLVSRSLPRSKRHTELENCRYEENGIPAWRKGAEVCVLCGDVAISGNRSGEVIHHGGWRLGPLPGSGLLHIPTQPPPLPTFYTALLNI